MKKITEKYTKYVIETKICNEFTVQKYIYKVKKELTDKKQIS